MDNGDENPTEIYYSNGGELNLNTNKITPAGGLTKHFADAMHMQANLLPVMDLSNTEKVVSFSQYRRRQSNVRAYTQLDGMCTQPETAECAGGSRLLPFYRKYHDERSRTYGSQSNF